MSAFGAEKTDAFAELDEFLANQGKDVEVEEVEGDAKPSADGFDDLLNTKLEQPAEEAEKAEPAPAKAEAPAAQQAPDDLRDSVAYLARLAAEREAREERARQMQEEEQQAKQQAKNAKLFDEADLALTEEERQVYGQSEGVITKVARSAVQNYHDQFVAPLLQELRQYREDTKHIEQRVLQTQEQSVMSRLGAAVPDMNERVQSAGWQSFVSQQAPYMQRGVTMGQLIEHHLKAGDVEAAAEVMRAYDFQGNTPARVAATTPTPKRVGGGGPPASMVSKQAGSEKLPISRFNQASEMAERGQITPERYNKIVDLYLEAEEKGLVDYSK